MNSRDYKEFAPNEIYHIYNRGVGKMNIFEDKEDFGFFLYRLEECLFPELADRKNISNRKTRRKLLPPNSFDLISYCLMPNHLHLLVKQNHKIPVSKLMWKVCTGYSKYFNKKNDRVGSLFQDQFKSVRIEKNEQLLWTSIYIHENPLKAGIVNDLLSYEWSSYLDFAGLRGSSLCKKDLILDQHTSHKAYLSCVSRRKSEEKLVGFQDLLIDNFE